MAGNPKHSAWYSTPNAARKRVRVELTLPPETIEQLDALAEDYGRSKSAVVEALASKATKRKANSAARKKSSVPVE